LRNRALATSGAAFQYIEANGRRYGHIIDPRSGEPPSDGPASVTVLAPTGAEADALSTAFYLLGPDFAREYIRSHPDTAALFVLDGPTLLSLGLEPIDFLHNDSVAALAT
jgi:thiamine biosynthesis lipoprotein